MASYDAGTSRNAENVPLHPARAALPPRQRFSASLGTDLTNDHPVGSDAQYPPDPAPVWWSHAFRPAEDLQVRLYDWEDQAGVTRKVISCVTCHDEHNAGNIDGMLKISNNASALCLDCHLK